MAFTTITSGQTDAKSPIDVALMDTGLRLNLDDHEARIVALEGGGGGSGGGGDLNNPNFAVTAAGLETNDAKFFRRRFHVATVTNGQSKNIESFDFEGNDPGTRFIYDPEGRSLKTSSFVADTDQYKGQILELEKNEKIAFKLKRGENHFGISYHKFSGGSDSITVTIDGASVTSESLVDENGTALSDTFSSNSANDRDQVISWFFGLDENKEQIISIENTDSGSNEFEIDLLEKALKKKKEEQKEKEGGRTKK